MGMFDYVKYEADCSNCEKPLDDFQSKAGHCQLQLLPPAKLLEQGGSGSTFYSYCDCGTVNYFYIMPPENLKIVRESKTKEELYG